MQMTLNYALALFGLKWNDRTNIDAICKAWKLRLKMNHPDKNGSLHATEWTQRFNQAKDTLLSNIADEANKAREMQAQEPNEEIKTFHKQLNTLYRKAQQDQFNPFKPKPKPIKSSKPGRKREPGTRAHRKTTEYEEGKQIIEEMQVFFKKHFIPKSEHILMAKITEHFIENRGTTTLLEKQLFHRHARRMLAAAWPYARYTKYQRRWSFYGIAFVENK